MLVFVKIAGSRNAQPRILRLSLTKPQRSRGQLATTWTIYPLTKKVDFRPQLHQAAATTASTGADTLATSAAAGRSGTARCYWREGRARLVWEPPETGTTAPTRRAGWTSTSYPLAPPFESKHSSPGTPDVRLEGQSTVVTCVGICGIPTKDQWRAVPWMISYVLDNQPGVIRVEVRIRQ
jgi:hypothetical protein